MNAPPYILNWVTPTVSQREMEALHQSINLLLGKAGLSQISKFSDLKFHPVAIPKEAFLIQFPFFAADPLAVLEFKNLLWQELSSRAKEQLPFVVSVLPKDIFLIQKKLVVFDMDSTFINQEVIDELARAIGKYEEVAKLTEEAMRGNIPFSESLKTRCKLLTGLSIYQAHNIVDVLSLTPGAQEFTSAVRNQGIKTAIVSGGFDFVLRHFQKICSIDHVYANQLEQDEDDNLTGDVLPPIVDAEYKKKLVANMKNQYSFSDLETITVGDGANDLPMMTEAGVQVSFCGRPKLNAAVNTLIFDRNLRWLEIFLGN